jgi:hypothetical protein
MRSTLSWDQKDTMSEKIMRTLSITTARLQSVATQPSQLTARLQSWWLAYLDWRTLSEKPDRKWSALQGNQTSIRHDLHDPSLSGAPHRFHFGRQWSPGNYSPDVAPGL